MIIFAELEPQVSHGSRILRLRLSLTSRGWNWNFLDRRSLHSFVLKGMASIEQRLFEVTPRGKIVPPQPGTRLDPRNTCQTVRSAGI